MSSVADPVGQPSRLLMVGSDAALRAQWLEQLPSAQWRVKEARSGAEAFEILLEEGSELMVVASELADLDKAEFEELARSQFPGLQIIRLEAPRSPSAPSTVSTKPGQHGGNEVTLHMEGIVARADLHEESLQPRGWHELVGGSAAMRRVYHAAKLVARRDTTVLIEGESGTGKDLLARAIHASGSRAGKPFVVINCAAIPETLLESELFGYTKGAFTGAAQSRLGRIHAAHGGTLFLDEIGDMPLVLQSKILRFLEQGEVQRIGGSDTLKVDCRVIAATNVDLKRSVAAKQFREDLYYRLAVFPLALPPLRERLEDLDDLLTHFVGRFCPGTTISLHSRQILSEHNWPGNVRELRNVLERASVFAEDRGFIEKQDIFL